VLKAKYSPPFICGTFWFFTRFVCVTNQHAFSSFGGCAIFKDFNMSVQKISTGSPFEKQAGYSRAIRDGEWVHVAGTTGYDYTDMSMPEDVAQQADNCFKTIEAALEEAGSSLRDVVRARYYITDPTYADAVFEVTGKHFGHVRPAATMVVAGLIKPEMKIEIEVTARIGAGG
jgi:enamine deaminase RidA (YjgF/YER057c/UK114 family)